MLPKLLRRRSVASNLTCDTNKMCSQYVLPITSKKYVQYSLHRMESNAQSLLVNS